MIRAHIQPIQKSARQRIHWQYTLKIKPYSLFHM